MAITAVLKWQNQDSTKDLNSRFGALFTRGILTGGTIQPVLGSLAIDVQPFTAMSQDGMLVTSDNAERLTIPLNQTNIVALHAKHQIETNALLELVVIEASVFYGLIDRDNYTIFGTVTTASPATEVDLTDISYSLKENQDKRGRSKLRGVVSTISELPPDPNYNYDGDFYVIAAGSGSQPNLYSWDGLNWVNITATASIVLDLAQHRANLFTNEIHLTDTQADAALGSSGSPSITNKYVTESDTKLPTQAENDALVGTHGVPSSTNKYVTGEYPVAAPTYLNFFAPAGAVIPILAANGPVYVGKDVIGSANKYFTILDYANDIGYLNSFGQAVKVNGVYKDIFITTPLNPATDVLVDSDGFFSSADLFLGIDNLIDTPSRIVFGKRSLLKNLNRSSSVLPNPGIEVICGTLLEKIANIKGRAFDTVVPTSEQNINLRRDIDSISGYIGSVLQSNVIAGNEDFIRLASDPILGPYFTRNVGISNIITFENTGIIGFTYDSTSGLVQYSAPVDISGVRVGDIFRDGGGVEYLISTVDDVLDTLTIVNTQTGLIPASITTSVGTALDGSTRINNNPRDLLLSEMKFSHCAEFISTKNLVRKADEFSKPGGLVAYGIIQPSNRFDPRIVFFGSWENYTTPTRETYVRNASGSGSISITGFFTELALVLRRRNNSPALNISIDGQPATLISTSGLGSINANVSVSEGPKYHQLLVASGLPSTRATTVTISIASVSAGSLDIYGIMSIRTNSAIMALLESGRAFDTARILERDAIDASVPVIGLLPAERGGRLIYSLADNSYNTAIGTLLDMDVGGIPSGTCLNAALTIVVGVSKLSSYRVNDVILIYKTTAPAKAEIRRIVDITGAMVTLDFATSFTGDAVLIQHICSSDSNLPLPEEEEFVASYTLPKDFINHTSTDFQITTSSDRFIVGSDGLTIISGQEILVTGSDVTGANRAIQVQSGGSSSLRFTVLATRLDILAVNASPATATISIDGSPNYSFSFSGGAIRRTIFSNARYQTHEIVITPTTGNISISELFLFGPKKPLFVGYPNEVADLSRIARYKESYSSLTVAPNVYPTGAVFKEASHYISYIDGLGTGDNWTVVNDYSKTTYGKYIAANKEGANVEFYVMGQAFELQYITGPDHGSFEVLVDGTALESVGGTIVGDYTGNQVDAYAAIYGRKNIGIYGLGYGFHKVVARIKTPRSKNGAATNYNMAFVGYYHCNHDGYMSLGMSSDGYYTSIVDTRVFIPLDIKPLSEGVQVVESLAKAAKVAISSGALSVVVNFSEPFVDDQYIVTPSIMNIIDPVPNFQPFLVTAQTPSSFTVTWNTPMPTSNYILNFYARTVDA